MRTLLLFCVILWGQTACRPGGKASSAGDSHYSRGSRSTDGTGRYYSGREIAPIMGHEGVSWLERPERTKEEGTDQLLDALDIKPTDVVADFGAGSGYFSFRIAARATKGAVLAVDIQPEMLAAIEEKKQQHHVPTLRTILGTEKDPGLPQDSVDLVLLVDVYHELRYPLETMQAIARSLKPTGRVALVEYRGEDPSIPIKPLHKMTEAQVRKEMKLAGLTWLGTVNTLPQQHLIFFGKGEARRP